MEDDETCNIRLSLGLGMGGYVPILKQNQKVEEDINNRQTEAEELISLKIRIDERHEQSDHNNNSCRKKLRLTKEQSAMLEDSFKLHTCLNPVQKQELAQQLNLQPRQVEVWFQNRRARRKVKQREVEWEMWKKCWENVREENRRLKREVEELKLEMAMCSNNKVAICSWCKKPLKLSPINIHAHAKP